MTNIQTFAGGMAWAAFAALLMGLTLEPVAVEQTRSEPALQLAVQAPAPAEQAA